MILASQNLRELRPLLGFPSRALRLALLVALPCLPSPLRQIEGTSK